MKIFKINNTLITAALLLIALYSCKKKNDDNTPATANGNLLFHIHASIDSAEIENYSDTLTMKDGTGISVTRAQLYLSNIKLVKADGSTVSAPAVNLLVTREHEQYLVGTVPAGNYAGVKFDVGLSAATNAAVPPVSDTMLYRKDMWFHNMEMSDNFIFVNFEGSVDTSAMHTGMYAPFSYLIGTNANLRNVSLNESFTIEANHAEDVHMLIDYAKLFNGVQLDKSMNLNIALSTNSGMLASKVVDNIPLMFRVE